MLKVASYVGTSRTPCSDLNVFNSKNPYTGFLGILDSGAASGFAPTGWLQHITRVVNIKTPVKVKLGTSISSARSKGLIPICIANAADKQDCLVCSMEFYCADNFFPDLLLIPLSGLSKLSGAAPLNLLKRIKWNEQ